MRTTLYFVLLFVTPSQSGYASDANRELTSSNVDSTVLPSLGDSQLVHYLLSPSEYGFWILYTCISTIGFVALGYCFRRFISHLCTRGFRGIRAIDMSVRLHTEHGVVEISLSGTDRALPTISGALTTSDLLDLRRSADARAEAAMDSVESGSSTSDEHFHECSDV